MSSDSTIQSLIEALQVSPDNLPLRMHLAETLLNLGRAEESESEYRLVVERDPDRADARIGMASASFQQGKYSQALVIIEDLVAKRDTPAAAYLLHSRLLLQRGEVEFAVGQYKAALREDPAVRDDDLAGRLGIDADETSEVVDGRIRSAWDEDDETPNADERFERPKISFDDVGGMQDLKEEIRMKIIYPLQHKEMFAAYGKQIGGGILMYGPPGCGKTHLARATAGEISAGFLGIGIHDVLDMWIGSSEKALHGLFQNARQQQPTVMFFDEVDALGEPI